MPLLSNPTSHISLDQVASDQVYGALRTPSHDALQNIVRKSKTKSVADNIYVIEASTITRSNCNTDDIINVLIGAKPGLKLQLRGLLDPDADQIKDLRVHRDKSDLWVEYSGDFSGYTIGSGPITIWIPSPIGWLEIRPSAEYQETYTEMSHAIGVYSRALEFYERLQRTGEDTDFNHVAVILLRYLAMDAGGILSLAQLAEIIVNHRDFMLWEISKEQAEGNASVQGDMQFFDWVYDGCQIHGKTPVVRGRHRVLQPQEYRNFTCRITQGYMDDMNGSTTALSHDRSMDVASFPAVLPPSSAPTAQVRMSMSKSYHGDYTSSIFPRGILPTDSNVVKIAALCVHAAESGRQGLTRMNITRLGEGIYNDYSIRPREVCRALVEHHRFELLKMLPPAWSSVAVKLWRELSSSTINYGLPATHPDIEKMTRTLDSFMKGKSLVHRQPAVVAVEPAAPIQHLRPPRTQAINAANVAEEPANSSSGSPGEANLALPLPFHGIIRASIRYHHAYD